MGIDLENDVVEIYEYFSLEKGIKFLLKERNKTFKSLCSDIGMTENGLKAALKNRTIKFITLLQICLVLDITIYQLLFGKDEIDFSQVSPSYNKEINKLHEEYDNLKEKYKEISKYLGAIKENEELRKRLYKYMEKDHLHGFIEFLKESDPKFDPLPLLTAYREWNEEREKKENNL